MHALLFTLLLLPARAHAAEVVSLPDLVATPARSGAKNAGDSGVVIGVEDYLVVQDVPYASRDADAFRSFLVYTRGLPESRVQRLVSVSGSSQASRERIVASLGQAGRETQAQGTVWVFFSGHGVADPADPRKRLLLGDDVRGDEASFTARGLSLDEIRSLAGAGGAEVVLVLDACYGGAGRSGEALLPGTHYIVPSYSVGQTSTGIEWDAAGPNELSRPFDPAAQGAFSYFSTGALRGWADGELNGQRDGQVTAEEAQAYVGRMLQVAGIRSQVPVLVGGVAKVLSKGNLEVGPTDEQVSRAVAGTTSGASRLSIGSDADIAALAVAASQAREAENRARETEALLLQAKETEFATTSATLQAQATKEWAAVAPLIKVRDAASKQVVDAFVAKYGTATATVSGESRPVAIQEVVTAQTWIGSYRETGDTGGSTLDIDWVAIPAGTFKMGDERQPEMKNNFHVVNVNAFDLSRTEVTFGQYQSCVDAGACTPAHTDDRTCYVWSRHDRNPRLPDRFRGEDQPVVCVDWDQAATFARWVGGRLPSEAEWEYVARVGGVEADPWTDSDAKSTRPVGQTQPSTFGIYDLTGNVREWTQDCYHVRIEQTAVFTYEGAPTDGSAWDCPDEPPDQHLVDASNYVIVAHPKSRGVRGGSWFLGEEWPGVIKVQERIESRFDTGFRVARSIEP